MKRPSFPKRQLPDGISKTQSHRWQLISSVPDEQTSSYRKTGIPRKRTHQIVPGWPIRSGAYPWCLWEGKGLSVKNRNFNTKLGFNSPPLGAGSFIFGNDLKPENSVGKRWIRHRLPKRPQPNWNRTGILEARKATKKPISVTHYRISAQNHQRIFHAITETQSLHNHPDSLVRFPAIQLADLWGEPHL